MTIPIIILNYNSSTDCSKCISFLKQQKEVEVEIVVVDNCSREDDVKTLRKLCSKQQCTLIENHENRGYNAGNNIGLRYAAQKGYKYALKPIVMEFPQKSILPNGGEDGKRMKKLWRVE
jgi:GT2 family glycosyltransferase